MDTVKDKTPESFFARNEFVIRRLHSLSGLIPVGAYMVVHLLVNASILNGVEAFQNLVYQIHSLGNVLWVVEWAFIYLPILFHALLGFVFIFGMKNNTSRYPTKSNFRYVMQRVTGMIAFVFIFSHVLHLNGLIHADWFRDAIADPVGLAQFRPYNAASTAAKALHSPWMSGWYAIGVLACVYHFANGLWTMGITWGVWVTPSAQKWASHVCMGIGLIVAAVGLSSIVGFWNLDAEKAAAREAEMYEARVQDGSILPDEHKLSHGADEGHSDNSGAADNPKHTH
ncbi:MAG: succinate dehydrogenase cytochrome b558 subunit [Pirellulaceae bacterium]